MKQNSKRMGKYNNSYVSRKDREERDFKVREKLSGFLFDMAKLILTTISVASISPIFTGSETPVRLDIAIAGLADCIIMFLIGYVVLNKN